MKNYINHATIKLCIDENYRKDFIVKCSNRMKELLKDSANVKIIKKHPFIDCNLRFVCTKYAKCGNVSRERGVYNEGYNK